MAYKKKLIEVALPLQAINEACVREKSIRHGHPSTLHLYWARRPLASARAVLFASLVDDPSNNVELTEDQVHEERNKLFKVIIELVKWENTSNKNLLDSAYEIIKKDNGNNIPPVLDPFSGGGSIPLEAQKLGLESYATDLNPVSVIINKALIEIPSINKDKAPINPDAAKKTDFQRKWLGTAGLSEDVVYYSNIVYERVKDKIENYYPLSPNNEKIIAWIWCRTVKCPNPNCGYTMPLYGSNILSKKKGNKVWIKPLINHDEKSINFDIIKSEIVEGTSPKIGRGANFKCFHCEGVASSDYVKSESKDQKMGYQLISIVAHSNSGRKFYPPNQNHIAIAEDSIPQWSPTELMQMDNSTLVSGRGYGFYEWKDIFLPRQLLSLTTFSDEINLLKEELLSSNNDVDYINGIITYIAIAFDRFLNRMSTICVWHTGGEKIEPTTGRQMIPMTWDFAEANPFSGKTGSWEGSVSWVPKVINNLVVNANGYANQIDARLAVQNITDPLICTDPPYYDNIMYADLSDFFYVWLKRILKDIYPELFSTIMTPKMPEITANKTLFSGNMEKANEHFLNGLSDAAKLIINKSNNNYPISYYYAFKQTESDNLGTSSTGWETFLEGLIRAGYQITSTWPMRTELVTGLKTSTNVLSSSIVITARKRMEDESLVTRKEFVEELKVRMEDAVFEMMIADISPVDLQQSAIGPGMSVFTKYTKVLEADGSSMTVRTALQLINAELDRIQESSEIEMDADTRFCIQWFDTYGYEEQNYGEAETLARAKDISVEGLVNAGVFTSGSGKAKLKSWSDMPSDWDPRVDDRLTLWECTHHMVRELIDGDGQIGAARLAKFMGPQKSEESKELAYQLYHICDKRGWAKNAGDYNMLVTNWADIKSQVPNVSDGVGQETLF